MTVQTRPLCDPFDPPRLSREEAERLCRTARRYSPLTSTLAGHLASISPTANALVTGADERWSVLKLRWSGSDAALCLPDSLVQHTLSLIQPVLDAGDLADDALALLMEHAATEMLDALEEAGVPVPIFGDCRFSARSDPSGDFGAVVTLDGRRWPVRLSGPDALISDLIARLGTAPANPAMRRLPAVVSLRAGWTQLTRREVASLEVGDGIVVESPDLSRQRVVAVVGERWAQYVNVRPQGLILGDRLMRAASDSMEDYLMARDGTKTPDDAPAGDVGELPLTVVFELGRVDIPVGKLEEIGEGYVFDLARQPNRAVELMAGGRRIGSGEIVKIGDALGVKITQLSGD